jgi:hypothetical protein
MDQHKTDWRKISSFGCSHAKNRSLIQYKDYVGPSALGCNTLVYVIHFQGVRRDNPGLEPKDLNLSIDLDKDLNLRTPMEIK